jgi:hypothetical protein
MATQIALGEPVHLLPTESSQAGNTSAFADAPAEVQLAPLPRGVVRYAAVIAYGCVVCIGMTAWIYFLGLAVVRAVEWTLG